MLNLNPPFQYICLHAIQYACNNYEKFDGLFEISTISRSHFVLDIYSNLATHFVQGAKKQNSIK